MPMLYKEIDAIMKKNGLGCSPSEAHGLATGLLCANEHCDTRNWIRDLLDDQSQIINDDQLILENWFDDMRNLLVYEEFAFTLLLPDDDASLSEQLEALRVWCQGFLYAMGTLTQQKNWSNETKEIIKDISEFTKLDTEAEGEEAEKDFMEVTEYLRAAVMYLRTEFISDNSSTIH